MVGCLRATYYLGFVIQPIEYLQMPLLYACPCNDQSRWRNFTVLNVGGAHWPSLIRFSYPSPVVPQPAPRLLRRCTCPATPRMRTSSRNTAPSRSTPSCEQPNRLNTPKARLYLFACPLGAAREIRELCLVGCNVLCHVLAVVEAPLKCTDNSCRASLKGGRFV